MDNDQYKLKIKKFFTEFSYNVMHESGKKNDVEHYFLVITKEDTNNEILTKFFDQYTIKYSLHDLSQPTLDYMKYNKDAYYFIMVGNVEHNDPFYKEKDDFIRKNANNIICYKMIGEVADRGTHFENTIESYVKKIEGFSGYAATLAKKKTKIKLEDTKKMLNEKAPLIVEGIKTVREKVQEKLRGLKNKR